MKTLYTASVNATGGRNGKVKSENGIVDFDVRMPKALGGANDDYLNPELLFAAGYSACFDSALNLVLQQNKVKAETTVKADVSIGQLENGGFGLAAVLTISVLGISLEDAKLYAEKAHQICPYSNATRNNIDVELIVSNN